MGGSEAYPEVGLDDMGTPDLQLPGGLAIMGQLVALVIHNAHVYKEMGPPLAESVPQLLLLAQGPLTTLPSSST